MYGAILRALSDADKPGSLANRFRNKRFQRFDGLVSSLRRPLRILDIGGTVNFWEQRGWVDLDDVEITLVNLSAESCPYKNITSRKGDATAMPEYAEKSYDIVFSNSVIEHLFTEDAQRAMAREVMRIGKDFWVQTPNRWFPMEPHFQVPGWQWLPRSVRIEILMRRRCGRRGPCARREDAESLVDEVRLLGYRELSEMFPGAKVVPERFGGLVKSWIVHSSFSAR